MKLFFYYALHSFKNQLKKLFKTWVLIFILACMLLGIIVGLGVSKLSDVSEQQAQETAEQAEASAPGAEAEPGSEPEPAEEEPGFLEAHGMGTVDVLELAAGVVILIVLALSALNADKNGSKLFLPADVSLLFSAPMRPQSVLMFRLTTQLGTTLAASIYLVFQLPNLVLNLKLSVWAAVALILGWCFAIMLGKLLQVLLYLICANHPGAKPWVRRGVYAVLALVLLAVALAWKRGGLDPLTAAVRTLNAPGTRAIPLWGWLKGFISFAAEGRVGMSLLCLLGVLLGAAALALVIRSTKADFYEDAMAKSEELAAVMERQRSERATGLVAGGARKKERSERLRRDGMNHGWGASVFFFKTLYNRFRFAHLGFFTKTCETYLVVALGVAALERFALGTRIFLPVAAVVTAVAFFRSLGNPLEQDTKSDYFLLLPENTWAKLFWSLLGGTVNCLLDFLPGLVLAAILLGAPPLEVLGWVPFILTMDIYATCVGAFINLSVPVAAGKNIKMFVQILFVYFGLLPAAAIIAIGAIMHHLPAAILAATLLDLAIGLLFFGLAPLYIDPGNHAPRGRAKDAGPAEAQTDLGAARRQFSRMGLAVFLAFAVTVALQIALTYLTNYTVPELGEHPAALWLITFLPQYLVAFPLAFALLRRVPKTECADAEPMRPGRFLAAIPICFFLMYAGSLVGTGILALLQRLFGTAAVNPVAAFAADGPLALKLLFLVVCAPLLEELLFRRALIDRMRVYGEKRAVITSALMFALFHGNLAQGFYAFAIGLVFGYLYLRTRKLRWNAALHMLLNLVGSVITPAILQRALEDVPDISVLTEGTPDYAALATPGIIALGLFVLALLLLSCGGLVLLLIRSHSVRFAPAPQELPRGAYFRTVWCSAGMALFALAGLAAIVVSLIGV